MGEKKFGDKLWEREPLDRQMSQISGLRMVSQVHLHWCPQKEPLVSQLGKLNGSVLPHIDSPTHPTVRIYMHVVWALIQMWVLKREVTADNENFCKYFSGIQEKKRCYAEISTNESDSIFEQAFAPYLNQQTIIS